MEFKKSHSRKQSHRPKNNGSIATNHKPPEIHPSVPALKPGSNTSPKTFWHRILTDKKALGLILLVFIMITSGAIYWLRDKEIDNKPNQEKVIKSLEYQTVTPHGKPAQELGGWRRVSPPKSAPVYAYIDTIDNVRVSVSQQPLPDKFIEGTNDKLDELAKGFGATNEITADGIKVYVGTSAQGPQSALFIKNGLLILVKSQSKISDASWKKYAESLK